MAKKNGLEGVDKANQEIQKYTDDQMALMSKTIRKYATRVRKEGRAEAPHRTGTLQKNINVKGYYKSPQGFMHRVIGPRNGRTAAPFFANGTKERQSSYYFGRKLLFGGKISLGKVKQNLFMQRAREKYAQSYQDEMKKIIEKDIDI